MHLRAQNLYNTGTVSGNYYTSTDQKYIPAPNTVYAGWKNVNKSDWEKQASDWKQTYHYRNGTDDVEDNYVSKHSPRLIAEQHAVSTLHTTPAHITTNANLHLDIGGIACNYSSVIKATGKITGTTSKLHNETPSQNIHLPNGYIYRTYYCETWNYYKNCRDQWRAKHKQFQIQYTSKEHYEPKTQTITASPGAIFQSNAGMCVSLGHLSNSYTQPPQSTSVNIVPQTQLLDRLKTTQTIDPVQHLELPQGNHGLFTLNPTPQPKILAQLCATPLPKALQPTPIQPLPPITQPLEKTTAMQPLAQQKTDF